MENKKQFSLFTLFTVGLALNLLVSTLPISAMNPETADKSSIKVPTIEEIAQNKVNPEPVPVNMNQKKQPEPQALPKKDPKKKKDSLFSGWWSKRSKKQKIGLGIGAALGSGLGLYGAFKTVPKILPAISKNIYSVIKLVTTIGGLFLTYGAIKNTFDPKDEDTPWLEEIKNDCHKAAGVVMTLLDMTKNFITDKVGKIFGKK